MVTAYYISKLSKTKKNEIEDYYEDLLQNRPYLKSGDSSISSRCRVCLKPGTVSIFDSENLDILEALKSFGDVTVEKNDDFPKNLCAKCDMFIKTAIVFKKRAKQTETSLKQYYSKITSKVVATQRQGDENETDTDWHSEDPITDVNFDLVKEKKVEPKVTCRVCGKVINKKYYRSHLQLHNPNARQWVCEICGKSFKMKCNYNSHLALHRYKQREAARQTENPTAVDFEAGEEKKLYPKVTCQICGKLVNKKYYPYHLQLHNPNGQQWVCEVCGKSFKMKYIYRAHRSRHRNTNDFSHKCPQCPYRGRTKELLKVHMNKHSGEYRYMCTECPARFIFKTNLTSHMLKHKEPQFKCVSCKRAFHSKLLLQRHMEADHLGILKHVCNICGKAFGYRKAMMNHQKGVHKRRKMMPGRMPSYLTEIQGQQNESNLDLSAVTKAVMNNKNFY